MNENKYLLWLTRIDSIGIKKQLALLKHFGKASNIFKSNFSELKKVKILNRINIEKIINSQKNNLIETYLEELNRKNISFITILDELYMPLLKTIYDPPLVLYYRGTLPKKDAFHVSLIGTRRCTSYGKQVAYDMAKNLSLQNISIVSGMAYGIDSYAHMGAVDNNGYTIAVLGSGVDVCYPSENFNLMNRIIETGLLISEYPPGTKPLSGHFPNRNRIISGISNALIVVESKMKSGTLITVEQALEQGRDVFAVPGNITNPQSEGTNDLIKEGAFPITSYNDILNLYNLTERNDILKNNLIKEKNIVNTMTENEILIYKFITKEPISVDELSRLSNNTISIVNYVLTLLEVKGAIKRIAGQRFIKTL